MQVRLVGGLIFSRCNPVNCPNGNPCKGVVVNIAGVGNVRNCMCNAALPTVDPNCQCLSGIVQANGTGLCQPQALCAGDIPSDPVCEPTFPSGAHWQDLCNCYLVILP